MQHCMTTAEHRSDRDFTIDNPYLALMDELWYVQYERGYDDLMQQRRNSSAFSDGYPSILH